MKRIFQLLAFTVIASMMVVACKDDFSEQDFINNQTTAKAKQDSIQAANLNSAGELMSYTLQVLDDKTPVSGVAVVMSNPPAGSTTATLTATTDANGFATFKNVQIGSNTFVISKTGYYSATFIVDFGTPTSGVNYTLIGSTIVPIKTSASNQVPIFASAAGGSTATIKGTVTIESDLTNTTPEIPQGLTLKANLADITASSIAGNAGDTAGGANATVTTYFFNTASIGTATVDNTTGAYSMVVPAGADGRKITMIYPTISINQKVGYTKLNGTTITPLISTTVPATYGPNTPAQVPSYDAVPAVPGAMAVFTPSAPAAPGAGLKITTSIIARPLSTGTLSNLGVVQSILGSNEAYQLTNKGSGYGASPNVTITGGGALTQATASASLAGVATGVSITAGGSGYSGVVTFTLQQTDGVNTENVTGPAVSFTKDVGTTPTALTGLTFTLPTTGNGFETGNPFITSPGVVTGYNVTGFKWLISGGGGTGATATATVSAYVDKIKILTGGTGYTSAPSFAIAAPTTGTTATLVMSSFASQYSVAYDNSANSTPYKVTPSAITFGYTDLGGNSKNTLTTASLVDQFASSNTALPLSTVSGGSVVFIDQSKTYKTNFVSTTVPVIIVTPSSSKPAIASVTIDGTVGSATYGQVTAVSITDGGAGYEVAPTITISPVTGATGSGAKVDLSGIISYDNATKIYKINTTPAPIVSNQGSGYMPYLNMYYQYNSISAGQTTPVNFSGSTSVTVRTGDVIVNDVKYGTGFKGINVN